MGFDRYGRKLRRRKAWYAIPLLWVGVAIAPVVIAAPLCSKFVPTQTVTRVKNRVSKHTADAWAAWRLAHPNWKPNPKVVRPKYKMTTQEAVAKVAFACEATTVDIPTPEIQLAQLETPEIVLPPVPPVEFKLPPSTPDDKDDNDTPLTPVLPPVILLSSIPVLTPPPPFAPTPEPGSLYLLGTGLASLGFLVRRKNTV